MAFLLIERFLDIFKIEKPVYCILRMVYVLLYPVYRNIMLLTFITSLPWQFSTTRYSRWVSFSADILGRRDLVPQPWLSRWVNFQTWYTRFHCQTHSALMFVFIRLEYNGTITRSSILFKSTIILTSKNVIIWNTQSTKGLGKMLLHLA